MITRCALSWALALALVWPRTAAAQSDEAARAAFDAGRHAYADADYELALAEFNRSYELSRKPELLYNIAMTFERLRRDREAIDAFERYLAEVPSAENHPVVSRRLKALKASVAAADAAAYAEKNAAPTPEEVARAQVARTEAKSAPVTEQPAPAQEESPPVYSTWWFWTSIGTVVAAGVVTGIVLAQPDEPSGAPTTAIRL